MRSKKRLEWCTKFHAANAKRYYIGETVRKLGTRITEMNIAIINTFRSLYMCLRLLIL